MAEEFLLDRGTNLWFCSDFTLPGWETTCATKNNLFAETSVIENHLIPQHPQHQRLEYWAKLPH